MKSPTGPTIPRWQLGRALEELRTEAGMTPDEVAERLPCSRSTLHRLEAGQTGLKAAEIEKLLDMYGATNPEQRVALLELQKLGKQRGWWSHFGTLPQADAMFIGVEEGAQVIRTYEPDLVPGLLQTEDYTRAVQRGPLNDVPEDEVERQVQLRMMRQERILGSGEPPRLLAIIAESVIRWQVGGPEVMHSQLCHLLDMVKVAQLQIVPFRAGAHAGLHGALTILEFDESIHSPVAYVESQGGNVYMEKGSDIARCNLAYEQLTAVALSPLDSAQMIRDAVNKE